ncbi:MAG: protein kinase [Verrucomicrobia bacterium]|nr:protein kinase [Verrucomicrobiota bacterium]
MTKPPPIIPDYDLLRQIGQGAFGEVWLARAVTGQFRAVKVLRRDAMPHPRGFDREFQGLVRYEPISRTQPNLVQVLHVGRDPDGQSFWYVMELADDENGCPLGYNPNQKLEQSASGKIEADKTGISDALLETYSPRTLRAVLRTRGRLPVAECLPIALGLVEATGHLHARGLVHRDIKPSNVIFVGGIPKLADIGLVATTEEQPTAVGTAGYIPPDGAGTAAADIYALGKVLYEMATGREVRDFPRLPDDFIHAPDHAALVELNEIIVRAADADPRRRYASIEELRSDLLLLEAGRSVRRMRGIERRLRLVARAGAAVTAVAVLAIAASFWANRERLRAVRAERELAERVVEQQLALARATRLTGMPGQRERALEIIREAARRTNSLALRNEAIAALALPDARHQRTLHCRGVEMVFDRNLTRYATNDAEGNIHVRSLRDDAPIAFLPANRQPSVPGWMTGLHRFGFSPDGEAIGASYTNYQFLVWQLRSQPPYAEARASGLPALQQPEASRPLVLQLPYGAEGGVAVPGTPWFATDGQDGALHFFDLRDGREVRTLEGPRRVAEVVFSPDGKRFARIKGMNVMICDTLTGQIRGNLRTSHPIRGATWHPDGRQLVTWASERLLRLWNTETGRLIGTLAGHEAEVIGAAFDASGQWLASASWDNQTLLWSMPQQRALLWLPGSGNGLHFSEDARRLAWHSWDEERWDVYSLSPMNELNQLEQHPNLTVSEGFRNLWQIAFLDEARLMIGVGDSGFSIWQLPFSSPTAFAPFKVSHRVIPMSRGGFFTSGAGGLTRWALTSRANDRWQLSSSPPTAPLANAEAANFDVSTNGQRMAVHLPKHGLFLRSDSAGTNWQRLTHQRVIALSMEAAGRFLAGTDLAGGVAIWDAQTGSLVTNIPTAFAGNCEFSPDGRWLTIGTAQSYQIRRVPDWQLVHQMSRQADDGPLIAWSPDGQLLLLHDARLRVRLVKVGTWEELASLPAPRLLRDLCFNADGSLLALAGEKSGVSVWDLHQVRLTLAELGLDWDRTPISSARADAFAKPHRVVVDTGQ